MRRQHRANLEDFVAGFDEPAPEPTPEPVGEIVQLAAPAPVPVRRPPVPRTLKERAVHMSVYLERPIYEALRELSFHERRAMHALTLEGLDRVFRNRGMPPLKQLLGSK